MIVAIGHLAIRRELVCTSGPTNKSLLCRSIILFYISSSKLKKLKPTPQYRERMGLLNCDVLLVLLGNGYTEIFQVTHVCEIRLMQW